VLLSTLGFQAALWAMAGALASVLFAAAIKLREDMGRSKEKVKLKELFSKSREINLLAAARFFLFGARDVWFVVGLPIFLKDALGWGASGVGGFLAAWVIGYGFVQAAAPKLLGREGGAASGARAARLWGFTLALVSGAIALALQLDFHPAVSVLGGLALFGIVFAVNSSVHSYLILAYTDRDKVALNVGFYYMANACGRLAGTLFSGITYLAGGLTGCLWLSTLFLLAAAAITALLGSAPGAASAPRPAAPPGAPP
jgi:predicted MFS family arabinose efflux permease